MTRKRRNVLISLLSRPSIATLVRGGSLRLMYVELHSCSAFSFLEGGFFAGRSPSLKPLGWKCPRLLCLTGDGVYGSPRFHMAATKAGIRAHVGAEISLGGLGTQAALPKWIPNRIPPRPVRLALLVENRTGYQNLCRLITRYKRLREKGKGTGTATLDEVAECGRRTCLPDGWRGGVLKARALDGGEGNKSALRHRKSGFDLRETQCVCRSAASFRSLPKRTALRLRLRSRRACILPLLATNGVRYARPYDREVLDVFYLRIRNHCRLEEAGRLLERNDERHVRSAAAMAATLLPICRKRLGTPPNFPRASDTRSPIWVTSSRCTRYLPATRMDSFLRKRAEEGVCNRYARERRRRSFCASQTASGKRACSDHEAETRRIFPDRVGHRSLLSRTEYSCPRSRLSGEQRGVLFARHYGGRSSRDGIAF